MKATEYYERYQPKFSSPHLTFEDINAAIRELLLEFNDEAIRICNVRNVMRNSAVLAVLREQNQKWNALTRIFRKKRGVSPLKEDGFINLWYHKMPELKILADVENL